MNFPITAGEPGKLEPGHWGSSLACRLSGHCRKRHKMLTHIPHGLQGIHGGVLSSCRSTFQPSACFGRREWKTSCFFRASSEIFPVHLRPTDCEGLQETWTVVLCFLRVTNRDSNQCAVTQEDLGSKVSAKMSTYLIMQK